MTDAPYFDPVRAMTTPPSPARLRSVKEDDYPPCLTAGNRVVFDTPPPIDGVLSIDKLAFTFELPKDRWVTFRKWMQRLGSPQRGGRIYREALEIADPGDLRQKVLIQWAPYLISSVPFVRVEFNPTKAEGYPAILERHILPFLEHDWDQVHITRIDAAVDYPVALQEHVYFAGNHKGIVYYSQGIETVYLGSAHSDTRLRVYDKAKELATSGEPVPEHPLTRIEAQRRFTHLSGAELDRLRNPFARLKIARPLPANLPLRYKLYFEHSEKHGVDCVIKQLSRAERKRFKAILDAMPPTVRHPADVFTTQYPALCLGRLLLFFGWKQIPSDEECGGGCKRPLAA